MRGSPVTFPAASIPTEPGHARLLGLNSQRQEGLWMQRVRILGGRLTGAHWHALADIARRWTPGEPLHLTTRQDVEIHGLSDRAVPPVQQALAEVGLTGLGAGGDTLRNVTVCPCSGVAPGAPELLPLATGLTDLLQAQPAAFNLPRKFKVSLSACPEACGLPWLHDVGLVAEADRAECSFRATVAGSLGHSPQLGLAWPFRLRPGEVRPFVLAVWEIFAEHGDRRHRSRARLRDVRDRLGDEAFLGLLADQFQRTRQLASPAEVMLPMASMGLRHRRRVAVPEGNIPLEVAEILGEWTVRNDMAVRLGIHHEIWLYADEPATLDEAIRRLPPQWRNGPAIVACPGIRWCSRGRVDTQGLASRLRDLFAEVTPDRWIAISGCPNGCAHSAVAGIGLIGRSGGEEGETYRILTDGSAGREPRLGQLLQRDVSAEQVPALIRDQGIQSKDRSDAH
jgi:sulfite reductase (ferredoxin)